MLFTLSFKMGWSLAYNAMLGAYLSRLKLLQAQLSFSNRLNILVFSGKFCQL